MLKRGIIKERITYYINNGLTDPNQIFDKLQTEFPDETIKRNSINSYISILKPKEKKEIKSAESETNDINNVNGGINSNDVSADTSNDNPNSSSLPSSSNIESEVQESQEVENNEAGFPVQSVTPTSNLIHATKKFDLTATEAPVLPEASAIAESYSSAPLEVEKDPEQEKKTQIHLDRFGEIAGDGAQIVFNSKPFQKLSKGYKVEEKEIKRINEDMSIILKERCPVIFSEYGDVLNLAGDMVRITFKGLVHRFKVPMSKEFDDKVKESEKNVEAVVQEVIKEMPKPEPEPIKEFSTESETSDKIKCVDCGEISAQDLDSNGRCPNCHFNHTIAELQKSNQG